MVYGRVLEQADMRRWVKAFARSRAVQWNPRAFTKEETIAIAEEALTMELDLLDKYAGEDRQENLFVTVDGMIVDTPTE